MQYKSKYRERPPEGTSGPAIEVTVRWKSDHKRYYARAARCTFEGPMVLSALLAPSAMVWVTAPGDAKKFGSKRLDELFAAADKPGGVFDDLVAQMKAKEAEATK